MGLTTLNIVGSDAISKTLIIYSNTEAEQLFSATWNIADNMFSDNPTTDTGWTAFKTTYVTVGTGANNINIDLTQWAADNGTIVGGEPHSFTLTSYCNDDSCQSDLNSITEIVYVTSNWDYLLADEEADLAYSDARLLNPDYTGALIKVRRSSDNTEQDIPFVLLNDEYVLNETNLLAFVGTSNGDHGYITKRYNQSGSGVNHASQTSMSAQPPIVVDGVVLKDPESDRPAHLCDGTNHFFDIEDSGVNVSRSNLNVSVFSDAVGANGFRVGIGTSNNGVVPSTWYWLISGSTSKLLSVYATPSVEHFTSLVKTGGFICITSADGANPATVSARLNGVVGVDGSYYINESSVFNRLDSTFNHYARHKGYKSEDVLYGTSRVKTEAAIETNVNDFYQMF